VASLLPAFKVALSEPGLNHGKRLEVPTSHQQYMPIAPLAAISDHMIEQHDTLVQPQRLHFSGIHAGVSATGTVRDVALATLLSQQDEENDSPPIAAGAAQALPTAASLTDVFNSSNSSDTSTTHKGDSADATLLSEKVAKDDSPPIATVAADAIPIAATLSGVFNSSNSSTTSASNKGDSTPSADESK
jgi:hypothetical protein